MGKNSVYIMDILSYFVLSVISVFIGYSNLLFIESVESEYNIYNVYAFNSTNEIVSFIVMFIASIFLLYFVYRVNKETRDNSIFSYLGKQLLLLFIVLVLLFSYAVMPYVFMISLPNQVIPTSRFTQILKYGLLLLPIVFFLVNFIISIIYKISGSKKH